MGHAIGMGIPFRNFGLNSISFRGFRKEQRDGPFVKECVASGRFFL